jgi:hypothetical protein
MNVWATLAFLTQTLSTHFLKSSFSLVIVLTRQNAALLLQHSF